MDGWTVDGDWLGGGWGSVGSWGWALLVGWMLGGVRLAEATRRDPVACCWSRTRAANIALTIAAPAPAAPPAHGQPAGHAQHQPAPASRLPIALQQGRVIVRAHPSVVRYDHMLICRAQSTNQYVAGPHCSTQHTAHSARHPVAMRTMRCHSIPSRSNHFDLRPPRPLPRTSVGRGVRVHCGKSLPASTGSAVCVVDHGWLLSRGRVVVSGGR